MVLRPLVLLGLAALAALPAGLGDHCVEPTKSPTLLDTADLRGTGPDEDRYYVFSNACRPECAVLSVWIVEESNGWDGLQRQDAWRDDTCGGEFEPDAGTF